MKNKFEQVVNEILSKNKIGSEITLIRPFYEYDGNGSIKNKDKYNLVISAIQKIFNNDVEIDVRDPQTIWIRSKYSDEDVSELLHNSGLSGAIKSVHSTPKWYS